MTLFKRIALFVFVFGFALTSCNLYPGEAATTEELDLMISQYDPNADFSSMSTYAISDKVTALSEDPGTVPGFTISEDLNNVIISSVKANMAAYGWQLVDSADNPDLAIDLAATLTRNTNVYTSYPGWGYPGYGYGWGWGYSTVTSYEVATLFMHGLDLKNIDHTNMVIPVLWVGIVQGPVIGNVTEPLSRVQRDINVLFETSPYLNLN